MAETQTAETRAAGPVVPAEHKAIVSDTFVPHNLVELKEMASFLAASDLIPKSLNGKKENVAIVLMLGHEIGVPGIAALTNIYVVNGRPTIWGDLATALVRRSSLCEELSYKFEGAKETLKCIATGKRRGDKEAHTVTYSWDDARLAGNATKDTYIKNPKDMIMWRALHRLFKFLWPDVLKGLDIREIVQDEVTEVTAEEIKVEKPEQLPETQRVNPNPETEKGVPEPTVEEVEALRQKKAAEFRANEEKKASAAPPAAPPAPAAPKPEEPSAGGLFGEDEEKPAFQNQVFGTVLKCVKKSDFYALLLLTAAGERKYQITYDAACDIKSKFYGQTLNIEIVPLPTVITGVEARVVKYAGIAVEW